VSNLAISYAIKEVTPVLITNHREKFSVRADLLSALGSHIHSIISANFSAQPSPYYLIIWVIFITHIGIYFPVSETRQSVMLKGGKGPCR